MHSNGEVEIASQLGPRVIITPVHTDETSKVLCTKDAVYEIKTAEKQGEAFYHIQPGVCYVDARGLVLGDQQEVRINSEGNQKP